MFSKLARIATLRPTFNMASTVSHDLPADVHAQLDANLQFLSGLSFNSDTAPQILSIVINGCARAFSTTKWPIDLTVWTVVGCEDLLASNAEIRIELEKAHRSGHYAEIRKRREWLPRSSSLY
jgi:hypothetical protein